MEDEMANILFRGGGEPPKGAPPMFIDTTVFQPVAGGYRADDVDDAVAARLLSIDGFVDAGPAIPQDTAPQDTPEDGGDGAGNEEVALDTLTVEDLRKLAADRGVAVRGTKAEIIERLQA